MSRPLRLEFAGAVYHVTSRGDRREPIYRGDADRRDFLSVLAQALQRFDAQALAYCLMGNHYHLVLHTRRANLSRLMRHLNGVYTQRFNRRHELVGHLFQGRFHAVVVDREAYLLSLCRYVERNPVACGLVRAASEWPWSSCRAHLLLAPAPVWLDVDGLHGMLLGRTPASPADRRVAARRHAQMLAAVPDAGLWETGLRQQVFLGDEAFVARMLATAPAESIEATDIPRRQRRAPPGPPAWASAEGAHRAAALREAYIDGGQTMTEIARRCGLSVSRVSRLIAAAEAQGEEQAKGKT